jgi:spore coat polysaccharide biosynthesis protein SpsF
MSETGIIIQARTGSTRLPNKIILPFYKEKGILELIILRIKKSIDIPIVVATTKNSKDDAIVKIALKNGVGCYRGNENNVLSRFIETAKENNFKNIIRICADNPFLDIEDLILLTKQKNSYDYSCFKINNCPSIISHWGLWAEKTNLNALLKISRSTNEKLYLEHVTNYIYKNSDKFKINYISNSKLFDTRKIRLTLDTIDDFKIQKEIFTLLVNNKNMFFNKHDILEILENNPIYFDKMIKNIKQNEK